MQWKECELLQSLRISDISFTMFILAIIILLTVVERECLITRLIIEVIGLMIDDENIPIFKLLIKDGYLNHYLKITHCLHDAR